MATKKRPAAKPKAAGGPKTSATPSAAARRSAARLAVVKTPPKTPATFADGLVGAGQPPAVGTVIYIHGIGNKPEAAILKCQWDRALFGAEMGDPHAARVLGRSRALSEPGGGHLCRRRAAAIAGAGMDGHRRRIDQVGARGSAAAARRPAPARRDRGEDARGERAA